LDRRKFFPVYSAMLLLSPEWARTLRRFHEPCRGLLPACRCSAEILPCGSACPHDVDPSPARLLKLVLVRLDLNERIVRVYRLDRLMQHRQRISIVVFG